MTPKTEGMLLGYEVSSGSPVYIENTHMLVTGLTNKSGKTTTIQALANRSGRRVLVFATKPGERVFESEHQVQPFYQEKSDWQYVEAILSATMKERMRFERAWIIRATKGTKTLREVDFNCKKYASLSKVGSLENNIFSNLHAYFDIVLPQIDAVQFSKTFPELEVGINVMDLTAMREETQSLVIRACLEHISRDETGIITVIPELWKFAPEGRGNPVKSMLEFLIRQGATRENFVWMDSQDLAGVDKLPLKQVYTWVLGLQTERNEVQHTLDQLPLPKKMKPSADVVMTLRLGHFILATPKEVKKVYVRPTWMDEATAEDVARGQIIKLPTPPQPRKVELPKAIQKEVVQSETHKPQGLGKEFQKLHDKVEDEMDGPQKSIPETKENGDGEEKPISKIHLDEHQLILEVESHERIVSVDDETEKGMVIKVLSKAARPLSQVEIIQEAAEYGRYITAPSLSKHMSGYVAEGVIFQDGRQYRLPRFVRFDIKIKEPVLA